MQKRTQIEFYPHFQLLQLVQWVQKNTDLSTLDSVAFVEGKMQQPFQGLKAASNC